MSDNKSNSVKKCVNTKTRRQGKLLTEENHNIVNHDKNSKLKRKFVPVVGSVSKYFLPEKRARKNITPKFLLGGNISDPLNLNSLQNESQEEGALEKSDENNIVEIIQPPNIFDPLNLLNPVDSQEYEKQLSCLKKRPARKRNKSGCHDNYHVKTRKQSFSIKNTSTPVKNQEDSDGVHEENSASDESPDKRKNFEKLNLKKDTHHMDKIVSPVVPQSWKKPVKNNHRSSAGPSSRMDTSNEESTVEFSLNKEAGKGSVKESPEKKKETCASPEDTLEKQERIKIAKELAQVRNSKYRYGNYNPYYGYETLNEDIDVRLKVFQWHAHLFKNKDVLDIGCNVGMMSIAIAKSKILQTKSVTGIDIDKKLIAIAKSKLKRYVRVPDQSNSPKDDEEIHVHEKSRNIEIFPTSFPACYGNLGALFKQKQKKTVHSPSKPSTPHTYDSRGDLFPDNITFEDMDYVPKDEASLSKDVEQYDLILCLSMTKWIHLNYGDNGIKLTFKRIFNHLRPGGKLILESHNWTSYKKKKNITDKIHENFKNIEFLPAKFMDYLLSSEVGFSHSYILGAPQHLSKGFRRPIQLFVKGDFTPNQATKWSDAYIPQTPYESRPPIYLPLLYCPSRYGSNVTSPYNYRPRSTPSYHMTSPFLTSPSPYYNPYSDSYLPSYDNNQQSNHVFMSPGYYLSSPSSKRASERTCEENEVQRSPSTNRHHIYHHIYALPSSTSTSSTTASTSNTQSTTTIEQQATNKSSENPTN